MRMWTCQYDWSCLEAEAKTVEPLTSNSVRHGDDVDTAVRKREREMVEGDGGNDDGTKVQS